MFFFVEDVNLDGADGLDNLNLRLLRLLFWLARTGPRLPKTIVVDVSPGDGDLDSSSQS